MSATATAPATAQGRLFSALHSLADEIQTEKQAAVRTKQGEAPTPADPGGYQGPSTSPTTSVDNRGQGATEGARSSENVSDVKADQGTPGVDSTPDNTDGRQDDAQLNIGVSQSATGEDPSVEGDYKAGKDDPGTSHPADTENNALDGHKYANASVAELKTVSDTLANGILADLANGFSGQLTKAALDEATAKANLNPSAAGDNPPAQPAAQAAGQAPAGEKAAGAVEPGQPTTPVDDLNTLIKQASAAVKSGNIASGPAAENPDLQAGYELATFLGVEKQAAQAGVADCLGNTIEDANLDAELFGSFFTSYRQKQAMPGESGDGEDHSQPGDESSGASDAEGADGGGAPAAPGEGGGGGGGGGGGSLGELLGGGGDPGGMMGGPPPGPEMGGGGEMGGLGAGGEEEALMQLVAALEELGIPLEELAQAGGPAGPPPEGGGMMGGEMGGMGGGMPAPPPEAGGGMMGGEMGGPPPEAMMAGGAPPMGEGMKLASAAKAFRRSGKYRFKTADEGTPSRALREQMKGHLLELLGSR